MNMEEKQLLILRLIGYFDYRFEQVSDILYRDKEAGHHDFEIWTDLYYDDALFDFAKEFSNCLDIV
jgi:hypothetical protein